MVGETVAHYRVLSELGSGGMGVVFLAEDLALNRRVALKFIRADLLRSAEADVRLLREARAAGALDHPNVATIYEVGEWQGRHFIAMAWYDGETLAARLTRGAIALDEAVGILIQIADGLSCAHAAGIVHRDLKPGNVILTREGVAKILDFGLAAYSSPDAETETRLTTAGSTMGTVAYMAPEQAVGRDADARADIWALGVIAYEMLSGRLPFRGAHAAALLHAIQYEPADDLKIVRPDLPRALCDLVMKALRKDERERWQSVSELATGLRAGRTGHSTAAGRPLTLLRKPLVLVPLVVIVVVGGVFAASAIARQRRAQWARDVAVPEAVRLAEAEQVVAAFDLVTRAEAAAPADPVLAGLASSVARTASIRSEPAGATVSYRDYLDAEGAWRVMGVTPLDGVKVPAAYLRWRFEKTGFETVEIGRLMGTATAVPETRSVDVVLTPSAAAPPGMVFVPAFKQSLRLIIPGFEHLSSFGPMPAFWIDRYEVTNADFKKFVDAGGYQRREYWQEPFVENGRPVAFERAIARFVDSTGRRGPATWVQAEPAAGEDTLPVTGVSWYEAAAYARFAGKQLPSIHHWARAADLRTSRWVVPFSNFGGRGPVAVGARNALHASGAFDMAGNVKEWVATDAGDGRRYILGGAWDDPTWAFNDPDARVPFERRRTFGFRCVTYPTPPPAPLLATLPWLTRDYRRETPAPDALFDVYRRLYAYDRQPLDPQLVTAAERDEWRREDVSIVAAYGGERMRVFLFLPKRAAPPFETVVFFPGSNAFRTPTIDVFPTVNIEFLVKSGRAVAFPEYKATFGRQTGVLDSTANPSVTYRDHMLAWVKDFSRTVDYLATRQDLSIERLAMFGISWGARMGSIIPAIDDRVKVQVLMAGGFSMQRPMPEVDQVNFAGRVRIPTLMLGGRYDFFFPVDSSQLPMFEAFRTPKDQKRHLLYDAGHGIPRVEMIKETLDWLDRFQPLPARR